MSAFSYRDITGLHLEITAKCNANCPMCARNFKGKAREGLPMAELSLADCKKIFGKEFIKQLGFISVCGVFGDPINASQLIEIMDYFYSCNKSISINIYTNGSLHSEEWWTRLAKALKNGYVIFGIDGVGETSSIHRRGTNYSLVMRNAQAFIKAGGKAKWDFIVFRHNENQVEEARTLSRQLGFTGFQIKKTSRFFKNLYESDSALDSTVLDYGKHPIFDHNGQIDGYLELPKDKSYINDSEQTIQQLGKEYGSIHSYFDRCEIRCQALKTHGVFVSALGDVFPCCTIYQQICYGSIFKVKDKDELNEYELSKKISLSAFHSSIQEIVEGDFFQKVVESWSLASVHTGKPKSCCRTCGYGMDMHGAQHTK